MAKKSKPKKLKKSGVKPLTVNPDPTPPPPPPKKTSTKK